MSNSDERTGAAKKPAEGGAARAPGGNLPGLAAFGAMQTYAPATGANQPSAGQQDVQPEASAGAPQHHTHEDSGQYMPEAPPEDHPGYAPQPGAPSGIEALTQAYHAAPDEVFEPSGPNGMEEMQVSGADDEPADLAALQQAYQNENLAQAYANSGEEYPAPEDQDYPLPDYQTEGYEQQYEHPAVYAGATDMPNHDPASAYDSHSALQTFEARYDQHPEVGLGTFADPVQEDGDQPFFHEEGQHDADFMESEYPVAEAQRPGERKSRKVLMLASGLIGALALGGAVAFAYKTSGGGAQFAGGESPPLIQADKTPVKAKPDQPGGKEFPHKNKRIYDRLQGEEKPEMERLVSRQEQVAKAAPAVAAANGPQAAAAASNGGAGQASGSATGHHKVKTLQIRPDGTVVSTSAPNPAQTAQPAVPAMPSAGSDGGVGVAVSMPESGAEQTQPGSPAQPAADSTVTAAIPQTSQQQTVPQPAAPQQQAVPQPRQAAPQQAKPAQPEQQAAQATPSAPLPKPKPAVPQRTVASTAPVSSSSAPADSSIFVVQVASRRSQAMALAAFADLQQKYTSLLGSYQPMIQSADLGNKGTWYRLRVGPMSKKGEAEGLCRKLKNAGLRSCLVRPL